MNDLSLLLSAALLLSAMSHQPNQHSLTAVGAAGKQNWLSRRRLAATSKGAQTGSTKGGVLGASREGGEAGARMSFRSGSSVPFVAARTPCSAQLQTSMAATATAKTATTSQVKLPRSCGTSNATSNGVSIVGDEIRIAVEPNALSSALFTTFTPRASLSDAEPMCASDAFDISLRGPLVRDAPSKFAGSCRAREDPSNNKRGALANLASSEPEASLSSCEIRGSAFARESFGIDEEASFLPLEPSSSLQEPKSSPNRWKAVRLVPFHGGCTRAGRFIRTTRSSASATRAKDSFNGGSAQEGMSFEQFALALVRRDNKIADPEKLAPK
eukprot:6173587-Pleurochrysis_carterae.AAC.4